jgi:hypothetical protein
MFSLAEEDHGAHLCRQISKKAAMLITGPPWLTTTLFGSVLPVQGTITQLLRLETSILCLRSLQRSLRRPEARRLDLKVS